MAGKENKQIIKTFTLAFILATNVFYFIPMTLYLGNINEFSHTFYSYIDILTFFAALSVLLVLLPGIICKGETRNAYHVFIATIFLLIWFQGHVLVWEYGLLDGRNIDWSSYVWRGWVDAGIWIVVLSTCVFLHKKIGDKLIQLAVLLFFLQAGSNIYSYAENYNQISEKAEFISKTNNIEQIQAFSSEQNVLHIILDSFQADIFNEIINSKDNVIDYYDVLDGFVFFKEHMGVFPLTLYSIPALLGGEVYINQIPKMEFVEQVLSERSILKAVSDAGFEVDIASTAPLTELYINGKHKNSYVIPNNYSEIQNENYNEALKILDLSIFRVVPQFLKQQIYNDQLWFFQSVLSKNKQPLFYYFSHNSFLSDITHKMVLSRGKPTYKLFHLLNTHSPYVINRSDGTCRYADGILPVVRETVTWQMNCTLDVVISLIEKMKDLGIYHNSLIIIMGDHGAQITPIEYEPRPGSEDIDWIMAQVTPLMLIKLPNKTGKLEVSNAPTSMLDTAETINSALNLKQNYVGESMFNLDPAESRTRKFYYYNWTREDWVTEYASPIREFIINGSIYDLDNWKHGNLYPAPGVGE